MLDRFAGRRGAVLIAALALLLTLPALRLGFMTDDRSGLEKFGRGDGPLVVYSLTSREVAAMRERGMFPWWTSSKFEYRFMRPLSALSHELDARAWPGAPWAMHLINGVLYALVVSIAWFLYRELLPGQPRVAALASLLFAIDDAHATAAGWIASRSILLATGFALLSVLFHIRARARAAQGGRAALLTLAAAGCFACSLLSAETGLATLAYLGAYALTFEKGNLVRRVATLIPEIAVAVVWMALYIAGHFGAHGLSLYRELSSPLSVLGQGLMDLPAWLLILLGPSLVDSVMLQSATAARVVSALLCLPLLAALYVALPRTREQRFFALGALLCLPPLFTTLPQDRLLMLASFGGFAVLASFLSAVSERIAPPRWLRATRGVLFTLHLVLAPLLFVPALGQNQLVDRAASRLASAVPMAPPPHIVLLNTPLELLNLYAWRMLDEPGRKLPDTFAQLYAGGSALKVRRSDPYTLELQPEYGWGRVPIERVFSKVEDMPRAGARFDVSGMEVTVDADTPDGRPGRVSFRFPKPLEDAEWLFLKWQGTRAVPWQPLAVGEEMVFPPLRLTNLLEL